MIDKFHIILALEIFYKESYFMELFPNIAFKDFSLFLFNKMFSFYDSICYSLFFFLFLDLNFLCLLGEEIFFVYTEVFILNFYNKF